MKNSLSISTALACIVFATGCSSSGDGSAATTSATASGPVVIAPGTSALVTPTPAARPAGGETMRTAFRSGDIIVSDNALTSAYVESAETDNTYNGTGSAIQVRNNNLGGVDVAINGEQFFLKTEDANDDLASWTQETGGSTGGTTTLTMWNAGIGGRTGLMNDQRGQKYHKLLGYYHTDAGEVTASNSVGKGDRFQGHTIIGNQTPLANVSRLPRQLTYDGYYYVNTGTDTAGRPSYITGDVRMTADFDASTVAGRASSVEIRENTSLGQIDLGDTMTFTGDIIGTGFAGTLASTAGPINDAEINGAFFGEGAQEAAGVIIGDDPNGQVEGYFTASDLSE